MRRFFIILLITLAGTSILAAITQGDPGYIRISYGHWLIETNFWFGSLLLVLSFAVLFAFGKLWNLFRSHNSGMRGWFKNAGKRRAQNLTTQGLLAFAEGNWKNAQRHLTTAAKKSNTPLINYLAAAQSAYEQGNEEETENLLRLAWQSTPGSDLAVGLTQAQLYLDNHKNEQCLATLLRLKKESPQHPFLLKLLKIIYVRLCDWQQLSLLLPELQRFRVIQGAGFNKLEQQTWHHLLEQTTQEIQRQTGSSSSTDRLTQQWERIPSKLRKQPEWIHTYAQQLSLLGNTHLAEKVIRKTLDRHWNDELIELYGRMPQLSSNLEQEPDTTFVEALKIAENWLKTRPNNAPLLLCLGRLALQNRLWGKAKTYFEASHRLQKTSESYGELCRLAFHMEDKEEGREYFLQGLLSQVGLPDLPLPDLPRTEQKPSEIT